ncbi:MAG: hypothetical protein CMM50_00640 [Rhodospirillaceae bacterium]|nr:hypothetical protein [Rhodospirillaceae bacterium]|tara:strand:- start:295 stop:693 length:399 start_codon:yes stop_codon:yes gene_type:complete
MIRIGLTALAGVLVATAAVAAQDNEDDFKTFAHESLLCDGPAAYDEALAKDQASPGSDISVLDSGARCMWVNGEQIEDIEAPWVLVLEKQGDKVKVQYVVENYTKYSDIHNKVELVRYTGWTAESNLEHVIH